MVESDAFLTQNRFFSWWFNTAMQTPRYFVMFEIEQEDNLACPMIKVWMFLYVSINHLGGMAC